MALISIFAVLYCVASKEHGLGLKDEEALLVLAIMLTWLFSYIGWFTIDYTPIPTDWLKQYILAILVTLTGGAFIYKKHLD